MLLYVYNASEAGYLQEKKLEYWGPREDINLFFYWK